MQQCKYSNYTAYPLILLVSMCTCEVRVTLHCQYSERMRGIVPRNVLATSSLRRAWFKDTAEEEDRVG